MMNLPQAIVTCLKKSFTFSGRASRSEYWWFMLFYNVPFAMLDFAMPDFANDEKISTLLYIVAFLLLPANISVAVRRLHDVNRSGWWCWISCTIVGMFFPLYYWHAQPGTNGSNDYGKKPD